MKLIFLLLTLIASSTSFAADLPLNSHPNILGNGWDCDRGFYKAGQACAKVVIPENASIEVYGSGWACNRGYFKAGQVCTKVVVPENASIDVYGSGWACNRGYFKAGQACAKVVVPENASIDVYGSGWTCNSGFKKNGSSCTPMTQQEVSKQRELNKAIAAEIQRRKDQRVSEADCETEYKTNAKVCISISQASLDCNQSYSGDYYRDCDATLSYDLTTNYSGGAFLDVEVECTLDIEYKGRQTFSTQTDSESSDESHNLYANGSDSNSMDFNFSFTSYQEVISVKASSARCEINNVNLY
ncbi:hypothetical protein [Pseudomonas sp. FW305-70]|uniref:hypothetical protein n=1 Tax=Pseudomonas sp. FW305-70 TaxID=2751342 RepID=UPI0011AF108C|nr:hypothetical protein [Pseudomonas sp. FW305-70]